MTAAGFAGVGLGFLIRRGGRAITIMRVVGEHGQHIGIGAGWRKGAGTIR
jgi:hypothetical protein